MFKHREIYISVQQLIRFAHIQWARHSHSSTSSNHSKDEHW